MSLLPPSIPLLTVLGGLFLLPMHLHAQPAIPIAKEGGCLAVLEKMKTEFAREPGRLILSVEDALITSEACACDIVRAAVEFAGSDTELIAKVVLESIRVVPGAAPTITECALKAAPAAASAIRAVLSQELGQGARGALESSPTTEQTKEVPNGKAPIPSGKEPAPKVGSDGEEAKAAEPENSEADWSPVGVSGIYLTSPRGGKQQVAVVESIKIRIKNVEKLIYSPIFPVTRSIPVKPDGFFK